MIEPVAVRHPPDGQRVFRRNKRQEDTSGTLTVDRNASGVGTLIVWFVRTSNGSLKCCARVTRTRMVRGTFNPNRRAPFHTTARFSPALPSRTVGLDHSSRLPNGERKPASLNCVLLLRPIQHHHIKSRRGGRLELIARSRFEFRDIRPQKRTKVLRSRGAASAHIKHRHLAQLRTVQLGRHKNPATITVLSFSLLLV
jgi:hypothetical protein